MLVAGHHPQKWAQPNPAQACDDNRRNCVCHAWSHRCNSAAGRISRCPLGRRLRLYGRRGDGKGRCCHGALHDADGAFRKFSSATLASRAAYAAPAVWGGVGSCAELACGRFDSCCCPWSAGPDHSAHFRLSRLQPADRRLGRCRSDRRCELCGYDSPASWRGYPHRRDCLVGPPRFGKRWMLA